MTTANNSSTELPPMYDPTQVEPAILKQYLDTKAYAASPDSKGEPYSIVIPPPNVTAALHLGHALNNTLQDVLTRVHRMRGFNTLWMPGTDHAGIATQSIVDKRLQQEGQPALKEYKQQELNEGTGRDAFIGKVTAWKDEYEETITNQLKEMGCSCDWDRQRFTMDDQCAKAVREAFFQLFKDGLIYRGKRLVNWDPISQTALADDEVEMQDIDGNFYYMKYPVCDADGNLTGDFATVATTRPETMLGDTAIAVNPDDEPRAKYIGQYVKLPIVNRVIPIVGDDYVVIPDSESDDSKARMASGFLKVTPAHDPNDYEIGTRHDLAIINVMAPDASISIDHGWPAEENPSDNAELKPFVGLAREEARKQIVIWFKDHDLMGEVKPYRHAVGHSYRSHVPIEPYYTDQWYVKVTDDKLKGEALRAMSALQRQPSDDPSFQKGGVGVAPVIEAPHRLSLHQSHLPDFQAEAPTYFATIRVLKNRLSNKDRKLVVDACLFNHGKTMQVHLVTAMPDHTHLLFTPMPKEDGSYPTARELLKAIKSYTAPIISKRHKFVGSVWNSENVETLVQDNDTFAEKWQYMQMNPVKANMVEKPEDYAYSAMPADAAVTEKGGTGFQPVIPPEQPLSSAARNLPHWKQDGSTYFVTYRVREGNLADAEREIALRAVTHWHGDRIDLHAAVVMQDHIHLLFTPRRKEDGSWYDLSSVMHSIKSFSANQINKARGTTGSLWQDESYDRIVRDEDEFFEKWQYVIDNPVKEGLADSEGRYAWLWQATSENDRLEACPTGGAELNFSPDRYAKTFQNWHENIRDWCISRQLWWGHRIPVWNGLGSQHEQQVDKWIAEGKVAKLKQGFSPKAQGHDGETDGGGNLVRFMVCVAPNESEVESWLESNGFIQDPDVLDTWFSSALWPMSTMGWPGDTPELAKWNPTSVLCTAREIITLWVSRMVMFNRYFKGGDLPFNDVFIHAMIQDGHGQKMSKSLGNGVDPMDIIHSHGADAMRYTLTKMTTQTQDVRLSVDMVDPHSGETFTPEYVTASGGVKVAAPVQERNGKKMVSSYGIASGKEKATDDIPAARNTSEKFDEGQKFANKLWNAFRFAFASLGELGEANADFALAQDNATLADRWILDRLGKTIESADKALAEYRFSDYATTLYDFVWRDLCDWYIEIVKRSLSNTPSQQRVLVTCLDASLRLLHPVMPFITERLWEALNDRVPSAWRGVPGLALEPGELLIHAAWPEADGALMDASAEASFEKLRSIVDAVRNARNAYKIPPKQAVEATTTAPGPVSQLIYEARYVTGPLTNCIGRGVGPSIERPAGSAAVLIGDVTVYLHDVIDVETEKARLEKLLVDQTKQVKTFEGRLSNKKYVDNAPANLVQETRDQHAAAVKALDQIKQQLDDLAG